MSRAQTAVPFFRTQWAGRLIDTCTITRNTARGAYNDSTLTYAAASTAQQYTGACLVRPQTQTEQDTGEVKVTSERVTVYVPHDTAGIEPDDVVTLDTVDLDADLAGAVFRVIEIRADSYNTVKRLICERSLGAGTNV